MTFETVGWILVGIIAYFWLCHKLVKFSDFNVYSADEDEL